VSAQSYRIRRGRGPVGERHRETPDAQAAFAVFDAGVHTLRSRLLPLAAALSVLPAALAAQGASAGTYTVRPCETATHPGLAIANDPDNPPPPTKPTDPFPFRFRDVCGTSDMDGKANAIFQISGEQGGTDMRLGAPDGTSIARVDLTRVWSGESNDGLSSIEWLAIAADGAQLDRIDNLSGVNNVAPVSYVNPGTSLDFHLRCVIVLCLNADSLNVGLQDVSVTLDDSLAPSISSFGAPGDPVRGTADLPLLAHDRGGGVFSYSILVDGNTNTVVHVDPTGDCEVPFTLLAPCSRDLDTTASLDTTALQPDGGQLADGLHTVQVMVTDAAGNATISDPVAIELHNAPELAAAPSISGAAQLGRELTATPGTWRGAPAFAYRWRRCSGELRAAVTTTACAPIAGATGRGYVVAPADVGHRVVVEVVATNFAGSESLLSAPTAVVAAAPPGMQPPSGGGETSAPPRPLLSAVSLLRTRFRAGKGGGTALRLTAGEAGRLSILIERARPGRQVRKGGKLTCAPVRRAVRRGRCTRHVRAGTLARTIGAGRNSVALSGSIGARKLAPGRYRLTLTERDAAGAVSPPVRLAFTIVRG
jgi:hypothetical protein